MRVSLQPRARPLLRRSIRCGRGTRPGRSEGMCSFVFSIGVAMDLLYNNQREENSFIHPASTLGGMPKKWQGKTIARCANCISVLPARPAIVGAGLVRGHARWRSDGLGPPGTCSFFVRVRRGRAGMVVSSKWGRFRREGVNRFSFHIGGYTICVYYPIYTQA